MKVVIFETIRRHFKNTTFLIFLVVLCGLALLIGGYGGPLRVWQGLLSATVLLLSCQLIGPEFSSGTLQLILAKPVRRDSYLLGRVAGVVAVVWTAALAASIADAMGRLMSRASDVPWSEVAASEVNLGLSVVIVCALMAFFGSFTRSYLNIALYFGIQITCTLRSVFVCAPNR